MRRVALVIISGNPVFARAGSCVMLWLAPAFVAFQLVSGCSSGLSTGLETPRNTLKSILKAARRRDLDRFLECLDIDYLRRRAVETAGERGVQTEDIKRFIKHSPELRKSFEVMMSAYACCDYEVVSEKRTAVKARRLVVKVIGEEGIESEAEWLFVHDDGKWRFDPEGTY